MPLTDAAILREPTITVLARPQFVEASHLPVQWIGESTDGERLAVMMDRASAFAAALAHALEPVSVH
jgi:thymidylate synthase (FAD)